MDDEKFTPEEFQILFTLLVKLDRLRHTNLDIGASAYTLRAIVEEMMQDDIAARSTPRPNWTDESDDDW